ncbi:MAG TPA: DUF5985 family protein [Steroidobacteraceae bacterium]|jgi:uncharacterized membrane protein HdeD (DUF308 family)|nr:DUF5985 family protein [Steroidobacteraceae bacterium]
MVEGFLLGIVVTASLAAGTFFIKFWKRTRDPLFLTFGLAFIIEGLNRIGFLAGARPDDGRPFTYIVRLVAFLLILFAIVWKNRGRKQ